MANPNRTDLNTAAPTGQNREYGAATRDQAALDAMPLQPQELPPVPGNLTGMGEPTQRPDEPLTAGAPIGPGPGPESRMLAPGQGGTLTPLQRMAMRTGNPRLRQLATQTDLYKRRRRSRRERLAVRAEMKPPDPFPFGDSPTRVMRPMRFTPESLRAMRDIGGPMGREAFDQIRQLDGRRLPIEPGRTLTTDGEPIDEVVDGPPSQTPEMDDQDTEPAADE